MVRQKRGECRKAREWRRPRRRSPAPPSRLGGLGERRKLPQRGLGRSPSRERFWCILSLKSDIWWHQFDYPENQQTKFCAVYTVNAIYANRDKKILATLMAFNDFSMVLTVVVFCNFFLSSSL